MRLSALPVPQEGYSTFDCSKPALAGHNSLPDQAKINTFLDHMRSFCEIHNKYADQTGLDYHFSTAWLEKHLADAGADGHIETALRAAINRFAVQDKKALFRETHIRTAIDVILAGLETNGNITCAGDKQCGKSGAHELVSLIEPVIRFMATGKLHRPIVVLTRQKGLEKQIHADLIINRHIYNWLQIVKVCGPFTRPWLIGDYYAQYVEGVADVNHDTHGYDPKGHVQRTTIKKPTRARKTPDGKFAIRAMIDRCLATDVVPIFYIDESHFGTNLGSVLDQCIGREMAEGALLRCFSATPYHQLDLRRFRVVPMWLEAGYTGLGYFNSLKMPRIDGCGCTPPALRMHNEIVPFSDELHLGAYKDGYTFLRAIKGLPAKAARRECQGSTWDTKWKYHWMQYRRDLISVIAKMIAACFGGQIRHEDGRLMKSKGMFIRFANMRNAESRDLVSLICAQLQHDSNMRGIKFVPYMDKTSLSTVDDVLVEAGVNGKNDQYVIYGTAAARMGCRFPHSTGFFLDFTRDSQSGIAEQQGCWGRAHGYGKRTMVIVSSDTYASITRYIESNGKNWKPIPRTIRVDALSSGRPAVGLRLWRDDVFRMSKKHPQLKRLWDELEIGARQSQGMRADPPSKHDGHSPNSEPLYRPLDNIAAYINDHPDVVLDGEDRQMYNTITMVRFCLKPNGHEIDKERLQTIPINDRPESNFYCVLSGKVSPYGPKVGRRNAEQSTTKTDLYADLCSGSRITKESGRAYGHKGERTGTDTKDDPAREAQIWCNYDAHKRITRVIAVTLLSKWAVKKDYPNIGHNYVPDETDTYFKVPQAPELILV
jgi:hypothetical protein